MDGPLLDRLKRDIAFELGREGPPEGFPAFHDIPVGRYISDEFWELERRHLWPRVWVRAGRADEIAQPGDYFTFDELDVPIVVVRGADGQVRAFYNTCQHRGAPVVREQRGSARNLPCQYHGWTYDITGGHLVSVPDERDFIGLCREERGLIRISCEVWDGHIFVNQDPEAATLRDWFEPALTEMEELAGVSLRTICSRSQTITCNWKVAAEAFLEVYHFRFLHARGPAGGDTALDSRGAAIGLLPNGNSRMVTPFSKRAAERKGMKDWSDWQHFIDRRLPDIPTINDMLRSANGAWSLFPNTIVAPPPGAYGYPFLMFWPVDKATTKVEWIHYAPKDWDGDKLPPDWQKRMDLYDEIMDEDKRNMAPMQRSLESPGMRGVCVNYQERRIWHLHEQIDRTIGIGRIPEELRVAQLLDPYVEKE